MSRAPVWVWLPGRTEPVLAAEVSVDPHGGQFVYHPDYLARPDAVSLDPLRLRKSPRPVRTLGVPGLPGVLVDAMPDGYGADRLHARFGRDLSALELLEWGAGDAVGAIAVCTDIEAKLRWRPHRLDELAHHLDALDDDDPSSRAIRRLSEDADTSAGGERPKLTLQADGTLWLAKLQVRGDAPHVPAREYAVMQMAADLGLNVPRTLSLRQGRHEVFLVERFDRHGDPHRPGRHLFASALTVLGLVKNPVPGDPQRSYLVLADQMRRWIGDGENLDLDLAELWRRMAFNALVGNKDDHLRNHGLLNTGDGWRLSPLYDVTPLPTFDGLLSLAVLPDGSQDCSPRSLLSVTKHFGLEPHEAADWLLDAAAWVAEQWRPRFRDSGVPEARLAQFAAAFQIAEAIAEAPDAIAKALDDLAVATRKRRGRPT